MQQPAHALVIWVLYTGGVEFLNGYSGPVSDVVVDGEDLVDLFWVTDTWNAASLQNVVVFCRALVFNIVALAVKEVLFGQSSFWRVEEIHAVAIFDPVWDGADRACLLTSWHGLQHFRCVVVAGAWHRVAKEKGLSIEEGPFCPGLLRL